MKKLALGILLLFGLTAGDASAAPSSGMALASGGGITTTTAALLGTCDVTTDGNIKTITDGTTGILCTGGGVDVAVCQCDKDSGAGEWVTVRDGDAGGAPAWNTVVVPAANQSLAMDADTTTFLWEQAADSALDAWSMSYKHTHANSTTNQTLATLKMLDSGGDDGDMDALLHLEHLDTNDALNTALLIDGAAGTVDVAVDVSDAEIDTALALGENDTTVSGVTVTATELEELANIDATTLSTSQWAAIGGMADTVSATELDLLDGKTSSLLDDNDLTAGINALTGTTLLLGDGADFTTVTADASAGTDPVLTFGNDSLAITGVTTFTMDGDNVLDDASTSAGITTLTGTTLTLGDGGDFTTLTADAGGTDPVITFASNDIAITNAATVDIDGVLTVTSLTSDPTATPLLNFNDSIDAGVESRIVGDATAADNGALSFQVEEAAGVYFEGLKVSSTGGAVTVEIGGVSGGNDITVTEAGAMTFAGTADITLPALSVDAGTYAADSIDHDDLNDTLTFEDGTLLDFGALLTGTGEGIYLPGHATDCSTSTGEGQICWEENATIIHVGDGAAAKAFIPTSAFSSDAVVSTTGAVTLQANAVDSAEITAGAVDEDHLAASLAFDDDDLIDLSAINNSDGAEGLILPQLGSACAAAITEGQICWDTAANNLWVGDGAAPKQMNAAGADSFGTIDNAAADSAGDTLTVTDSSTIDFTTTDNPEDLTAAFLPAGIDGPTWGDGTSSAWTFDVGATDPVITFTSDTVVVTAAADVTVPEDLHVGANGADGRLLLYDEDGVGDATVIIQAPDVLGVTYTLTLPPDDGDADEVLKTNGSGTLDWTAAGAGDIITVGDCTGAGAGGACFTGADGTQLDSNTDIILNLDADNNGTESFQIIDGADALVFEVEEDGDTLIGATASVADVGAVRLVNTAIVAWEDSENTQEVSVTVDASETFTVTATEGGIALATTTATECVMLDASGINCATTTGCTTSDVAGTNFDFTAAVFAETDGLDGAWSFELPDNLSGTTFTYQYTWAMPAADTCTGTTNDDVCFEVAAAGVADNENWVTATLGTAIGTMDTCQTAETGDHLYKSATSSAVTHGWTAGDRGIVKVNRDTDASSACADDNITGSVHLLAVRVCYEVSNVFSGEN